MTPTRSPFGIVIEAAKADVQVNLRIPYYVQLQQRFINHLNP